MTETEFKTRLKANSLRRGYGVLTELAADDFLTSTKAGASILLNYPATVDLGYSLYRRMVADQKKSTPWG